MQVPCLCVHASPTFPPSVPPQVKALQATLTQMSEMVSKMKQDRDASAKHVKQLQASFETVLKKIKSQPLTKPQVGRDVTAVGDVPWLL